MSNPILNFKVLGSGQCLIVLKITVLRSRKPLYLKTDYCFLFLKEAAFWKWFAYPLIYKDPSVSSPHLNLYLKPNIFHKLKPRICKKQPCLDSCLHPSHSEVFSLSSQRCSLLPPATSYSQRQTTLQSLMSPCFPHTSCLLGDDWDDWRVPFLFSGLHLCFTEDWQGEAFLSPSAEPSCLQASTTSSHIWYLSNYLIILYTGKVAKVPQPQ